AVSPQAPEGFRHLAVHGLAAQRVELAAESAADALVGELEASPARAPGPQDDVPLAAAAGPGMGELADEPALEEQLEADLDDDGVLVRRLLQEVDLEAMAHDGGQRSEAPGGGGQPADAQPHQVL